MSALTLYHNPRCSKSRAAKALLEERGVDFETIEYLQQPLSRAALDALQKQLGAPPREWVRSREDAYRAAGLSADSGDDALKNAIAAAPILLERPILVSGERAVVGRPPERVLDLLPSD